MTVERLWMRSAVQRWLISTRAQRRHPVCHVHRDDRRHAWRRIRDRIEAAEWETATDDERRGLFTGIAETEGFRARSRAGARMEQCGDALALLIALPGNDEPTELLSDGFEADVVPIVAQLVGPLTSAPVAPPSLRVTLLAV